MKGVASTSAKLANTNKRFYNHLFLALSMACWITLFGLPCYSTKVAWALFGRKDVCGDNKMGFKANIGTAEEPILVNFNSTLIADGYEVYAWCGFLPGSYLRSWPFIVQTMLFTVFMSTGSTVKLAWQGLAGTFCAVANVYLMCYTYPMGGADPKYNPIVAYLDLFLMLFLFLATKASTNTMMYGMSWTVGLMMHFMNPNTGATTGSYKSFIPGINWDGETTVTMLTGLIGSLLAVVATVFPRPMLNIRNVHADSEEIIKGVDQIFTEAIAYWQEDAPTMRRFALYAKMQQLSDAVKRVTHNLEDAYWETFDFGRFGRIRNLYTMFYEAIDGVSDEVFLLKSATSVIHFEGEGSFHKEIVAAVKEPLSRLKTNAIECLVICGKACKDGSISEEERTEIGSKRQNIEIAQLDLSKNFQQVMKKALYVSEATAAENLFVFGISQWAQETSDFAAQLAVHQEAYLKQNSKFSAINFIRMIFKNLASTFDPKAAFAREQLRYVFVNLMPIVITYSISMYVNGSIFTQYSAVMPKLLTLLVTTDHGIPFLKNAQRLTGVVFGHTMPLLVMSVVHMMDCHSKLRTVLHMASIFIYFFCFTFMYYASANWSSVGSLVAGFGVFGLLVPCNSHETVVNYGEQYKDIAQVIIAIMLKIAFTQVFSKAEPRDMALDKVRRINVVISKAFETFISGDLHGQNGLKARREELKREIVELEALAPLSDPSLSIVPNSRTPFKYSLLTVAMRQYRLILSDLDMLVLAMTGHVRKTVHDKAGEAQDGRAKQKVQTQDEEDEEVVRMQQELAIHKLIKAQPSWKSLQEDVTRTVTVTLNLFEAILEHDSEKPLKDSAVREMTTMTKVNNLEDLDKFYKEVSEGQKKPQSDRGIFKEDKCIVTELRQPRLSVAMNALSLSVRHATDLAAACFDHMTNI